MSETKFTQTIYSDDGEASIFAEASDDKSVAIFVSNGYSDAEIELESDLIIELAKSLIELAEGNYEQN